jgi:hypothetical protein
MGPCSVDPGDTLRFVVALVIGQGSDELGSVTDMRATIAEAKRHYEAGFNDVPPHVARALRAWPTLAEQGVRFSFAVGAVPEPVEIRVVDVTGRRIRSWPATVEYPGTHERTWDGLDDDGRRVRPGLYFLSARVGGRESLARVAFVR